MHELSGAFDRRNAISVERLSGVQPSRLRLRRQMWRNESNRVDRWPSMGDSHDLVPVHMVCLCPPSPMALDALGRVNEDTIQIKHHCIAFEVCHEDQMAIMAAKRSVSRAVVKHQRNRWRLASPRLGSPPTFLPLYDILDCSCDVLD